jgi:hypothetical protein
MSRMIAGLQLIGVILFWLVAWLPMALYCLLALALQSMVGDGPMSGSRRSF